MAYTVYESTRQASTHYATRIMDAIASTDIENGTFGYLNGLATNYTHVYNFVPGTSEGAFIVVADNPAWTEDNARMTSQRRDKYIIPAGTPFRVRVIALHDEFAISIDGVTTATKAAMKKDAYVTIDSSTGKLVASASAPTGSPAFVGKVMRERIVGGTLATAAHNYGYATKLFTVKVETLA